MKIFAKKIKLKTKIIHNPVIVNLKNGNDPEFLTAIFSLLFFISFFFTNQIYRLDLMFKNPV
jgi:hypothetical protein